MDDETEDSARCGEGWPCSVEDDVEVMVVAGKDSREQSPQDDHDGLPNTGGPFMAMLAALALALLLSGGVLLVTARGRRNAEVG
ncbi:LPXTG cell wall anchor domain-containing protein [Nocardioides alcanivorans]|uniref:LPXTG cell wall anchor domain-containing protein n=1 Tax=Nocardioides alcanivorans TaxID=2897352 RepID=UPI001F1F53CB|nr:LPXTG cell wall anchor domain-containing protein [Nocardioides alcanivorans]